MRFFLVTFLVLTFGWPAAVSAQSFVLPKNKKVETIKFQFLNNLIILPIEVNGTPLSFVLDSGVSTPILFNLADQDSVEINKVSEITFRGLGGGDPIHALSSRDNFFKIGSIANPAQELYVVLDKSLNFSTSLGIPLHGMIGYDLFRDFVVEIDYGSKKLKFHRPKDYVYKEHVKSETLPLLIEAKKAYINAEVLVANDVNVPVRMLLDTGSSDAIWLFENHAINLPPLFYDDFLGRGLGGDVYGKRTMVKEIKIGTFVLQNAKAAFPDAASFNQIKNLGDRNGSLGGEVLKRFNHVFDYGNGKITLRKNNKYNDPFEYNLSGIDLQHDGVRYVAEQITNEKGAIRNTDENNFGTVQLLMESRTRLSLVPEIVVSGIRAGSPAAEVGLMEGDVILAVNGKKVHHFKLQEILGMLNEKEGKRIQVLIERYSADLLFTFVLKQPFKKTKPR